jgi:hypothetical protein
VAAEPGRGVDRHAQTVEHLCGPPPHRGTVDESEPARLAAETDVLGHRHVRQQVDLLVHRTDARGQGVGGAGEADGAPGQDDRSLVRVQRPGEGLDQRRLPGSVLAHQRVDLAPENPEVDGVERRLSAVPHCRPGDLQERTPLVHSAIMA